MQPHYDTWDFEPTPSAAPPQDSWSFPDGNQSSGGDGFDPNTGLYDTSMGKGKGSEPQSDTWDTWDTWDTAPSSDSGTGWNNSGMTSPSSYNDFTQPAPDFGGKGNFDPGGKGAVWDGGGPPDFGGMPGSGKGPSEFGKSDFSMGPGDFGKGPSDFGKGPGDFGKGPVDFGKGPPSDFSMTPVDFGKGDFGKGPVDFGKGDFGKGPGDFGKGDFGKGPGDLAKGDFSKGQGDFAKGDFGKGPSDFGKGMDTIGKGPTDFGKGDFGSGPADFGKGQEDFGKGSLDMGKGDFGKSFAPDDFGKGPGMLDGSKGKGPDDFGKGPGKGIDLLGPGPRPAIVQPPPPPLQGKGGFTQPAKGMPSLLPGSKSAAVLAPPRNPLMMGKGQMTKGFDKGAPPPVIPPRPGFATGIHVPPPPPGAPSQMIGRPAMPSLPPQPPAGLAPELLALTEAEEVQSDMGLKIPLAPASEKKIRLYLLVTRLAPDLQEIHMQHILEQCGEVQAWRRGRGATGEPLSFGFVQFGDAEAAWKASTCLAKQVLCGQEIKILIEEEAENVIQRWRDSQKAALKVSSDEELEFELERKAVFCKALIESKVEEIYGPSEGGSGAMAKKREELREKEQARITRVRKRKAWREAEFSKELARVEAREKRQRRDERDRDDFDRGREQVDNRAKEDEMDLKGIAKKEDSGNNNAGPLAITFEADNQRALTDMVDKIQSEPRDDLFKMELDVPFLRNEKTFERKLRPWLERKIDLCMGGPQSDLVEYVLRRVNAASTADALVSDLSRYLDENAEGLVERMWRMLVFELMRNGLTLKKPMKEELLA